ncbi:MAG: hypothetical protein ABJH98_00030 [Reichenbachiella sp.]
MKKLVLFLSIISLLSCESHVEEIENEIQNEESATHRADVDHLGS